MSETNIIQFSRETADRVRHFHIAAVTDRTIDVSRYARQDRWRRRLEGLLTIAAYTASAVLMGWLVVAAISAMLVRW